MSLTVVVDEFRSVLEDSRLKLMSLIAVLWFVGIKVLQHDLQEHVSWSVRHTDERFSLGLVSDAFTLACKGEVDAASWVKGQARTAWLHYAEVPMTFSVLLMLVCLVWLMAGKTQQADTQHPKWLAALAFIGQLLPLLMASYSQFQGYQLLQQPVVFHQRPRCLDMSGLGHVRADSFLSYQTLLAMQLGCATWYVLACVSKLARSYQQQQQPRAASVSFSV